MGRFLTNPEIDVINALPVRLRENQLGSFYDFLIPAMPENFRSSQDPL